jgi:3-oxoacyl-[acyl-carrier-protein] synthase-3
MYVPDRILTNSDLEKMVDTSDEWIRTRTGIQTRHVAPPGTPASDIAKPAVLEALNNRGRRADELDQLIVTTVTPDMLFPSTACVLQEKIGAKKAWGYDLSAACSGFLFGVGVGYQAVSSGAADLVAVVGVDVLTTVTDWTNRDHCVLFGDACGTVILEPIPDDEPGIIDATYRLDGSGAEFLNMVGGGSLNPPSHDTVDGGMHYLYQDGRSVFKVAAKYMADATTEVLEKNGYTVKDLTLLVPHQANLRIIEAVAKRLRIKRENVLINIDRYGNTTSATIPLGLYEASTEGRIKKGDLVVLTSFGGGYTWGAVLLRWGY